jgi:hypothetical protein
MWIFFEWFTTGTSWRDSGLILEETEENIESSGKETEVLDQSSWMTLSNSGIFR